MPHQQALSPVSTGREQAPVTILEQSRPPWEVFSIRNPLGLMYHKCRTRLKLWKRFLLQNLILQNNQFLIFLMSFQI